FDFCAVDLERSPLGWTPTTTSRCWFDRAGKCGEKIVRCAFSARLSVGADERVELPDLDRDAARLLGAVNPDLDRLREIRQASRLDAPMALHFSFSPSRFTIEMPLMRDASAISALPAAHVSLYLPSGRGVRSSIMPAESVVIL